MAGGAAKSRRRRVLRYTFGGVLCLVAGVNVLTGSPWYLPLGVAATGGIILVGQRRIYRPGLSRSGDEIICRYIPWYEGNAYSALVLIPLMGVAAIAAGCASGNPAWLRWVGIMILGVTPLTVYGIVRMWRRSRLCITPSMLTVRLAERRSKLTEIRRECVLSIKPKASPNGMSGMSPQVDITYRAADLNSDTTKTVLLGLQLSVQPVNLLNALIAWKDGDSGTANELLDRVERILLCSGE